MLKRNHSRLGRNKQRKTPKPSKTIKRNCEKTIIINTPTVYEIITILNNMKIKRSSGNDGFLIEHFVQSKENSSKFIIKLIESIIDTEVWPNKLKLQVLRPVFKKGKKTDLNNYRPIALLPVINKIIEKYFTNSIMNFVTHFKLLNPYQYGYQTNKSTVDALDRINNLVTKALDEGKYVGAIMIDLKKAFDTIDKDILYKKLYYLGIRGKVLNIIMSYLTNRKCCVCVNKEKSEWHSSNYGVPQGSILGPVLFLLYINDLQNIKWNTYMTLYADDIIMIAIHNNCKMMTKFLQEDFNLINTWFIQNELYVSTEKTCYMQITTSHMKKETSYIIAHLPECEQYNTTCTCVKLSKVDNYKYLGITIDENWKFYKHIDELILRIRKTVPFLYKLCNLLNINTKRILFESWINSIIRYGCSVYGTTTKGMLNKLQKVQNKAMKVLFKKPVGKTTEMLYKSYKIMTVQQLVKTTIINRNYFLSEYKNLINRSIRNSTAWLKVPKWRNSYGKRGLGYIIPTTFNEIPKNLRNIINRTEMNREIKKWILSTP
jgi:hypothetical protein